MAALYKQPSSLPEEMDIELAEVNFNLDDENDDKEEREDYIMEKRSEPEPGTRSCTRGNATRAHVAV